MCWASRNGNFEIIDILRTQIWNSINISIALHPLIIAARFEYLEIAKLLFNLNKIDLNVQDIKNRDSLSLTASNSYINILKILLKDPRIELNVQNMNKWIPFF